MSREYKNSGYDLTTNLSLCEDDEFSNLTRGFLRFDGFDAIDLESDETIENIAGISLTRIKVPDYALFDYEEGRKEVWMAADSEDGDLEAAASELYDIPSRHLDAMISVLIIEELAVEKVPRRKKLMEDILSDLFANLNIYSLQDENTLILFAPSFFEGDITEDLLKKCAAKQHKNCGLRVCEIQTTSKGDLYFAPEVGL